MPNTYNITAFNNNTRQPVANAFIQALDGNNQPLVINGNPIGSVTDANGNAVIVTDQPVGFLTTSAPGFSPATTPATNVTTVTMQPEGGSTNVTPGNQPTPPAQPMAAAQAQSLLNQALGMMRGHYFFFGVIIFLMLLLLFKPSDKS